MIFRGVEFMTKILVTGATGQIGTSLVPELRKKYGNSNVIAIGHRKMPDEVFVKSGPFEIADTNNKEALSELIQKYQIDTIYHLVSLLSASGEKNPDLAWSVNMGGLKNVLDLAKEHKIKRVFWPSSIAAFGPTTPRDMTPQPTIMEPNTMYGVTKVAGELLCNYYFKKYAIDVRSLRYPGIISYNALPGGGTTDYAVEIFYEALKHGSYKCYLREDSTLPMMYMPDAIKATIDIMEAGQAMIKSRTSYNLAAISFSPKEIAAEIMKHIPDFACTYEPDFRQAIADSWPKVIDDSHARKDWGWKHAYDLKAITKDMLEKLGARLGIKQ
jgi:nucleoside-diphosphate-sugar epimerase